MELKLKRGEILFVGITAVPCGSMLLAWVAGDGSLHEPAPTPAEPFLGAPISLPGDCWSFAEVGFEALSRNFEVFLQFAARKDVFARQGQCTLL